jgi:hypothetical protein
MLELTALLYEALSQRRLASLKFSTPIRVKS